MQTIADGENTRKGRTGGNFERSLIARMPRTLEALQVAKVGYLVCTSEAYRGQSPPDVLSQVRMSE